jgi:hypothetical protein
MTLSRIRPPGRLFSPFECEAIANRAGGLSPSTPPVENSEAVGGPSAEDGQGVCTYRLHFSWPALDKHAGDLESIDVGPESYAAQWVELALKRGATVVSVERL